MRLDWAASADLTTEYHIRYRRAGVEVDWSVAKVNTAGATTASVEHNMLSLVSKLGRSIVSACVRVTTMAPAPGAVQWWPRRSVRCLCRS